MKVEEGFLEEVTLMWSLGERNRLPRGREDKERHSPWRKQHEQRCKVLEKRGILRSLCRGICCVSQNRRKQPKGQFKLHCEVHPRFPGRGLI